jgi:hypothetical protein
MLSTSRTIACRCSDISRTARRLSGAALGSSRVNPSGPQNRKKTASKFVVQLSPGTVPEGWPRGPRSRFEDLPAPTLIRRGVDTVVESQVLDPLLSWTAKDQNVRRLVLLDGERGVGKSTVLLRAVESARTRGIVTLYIPSARAWTHGSGFFAATTMNGEDQIAGGPDCIRYYDRPSQTLCALEGLLQSHGDALANIASSNNTSLLADRAGLNTLLDVVQFGISSLQDVDADWRVNPKLGADAFSRLMLELSTQTEVPFLLAIDDYDAFLGMTSMVSGNRRCLHADSIRAVGQHFGRRAIGTTAGSMLRGMTLVALNRSHGRMKWRPSRVLGTIDFPVTDDIRKDPCGSTWLANLRTHSEEAQDESKEVRTLSGQVETLIADWKFDPVAVAASKTAPFARFIQVPELTPNEVASIVGEFEQHGLVRAMNFREREHIMALSGGRADILHRLCKAV